MLNENLFLKFSFGQYKRNVYAKLNYDAVCNVNLLGFEIFFCILNRMEDENKSNTFSVRYTNTGKISCSPYNVLHAPATRFIHNTNISVCYVHLYWGSHNAVYNKNSFNYTVVYKLLFFGSLCALKMWKYKQVDVVHGNHLWHLVHKVILAPDH